MSYPGSANLLIFLSVKQLTVLSRFLKKQQLAYSQTNYRNKKQGDCKKLPHKNIYHNIVHNIITRNHNNRNPVS